jgi:putative MFS transporter
VILRSLGVSAFANPIVPVALLIIGSTGVISILLPYAAENYPLRIRGRATGWVAGCSKLGGLICQGLGVLALVPALWLASIVIAAITGFAVVLIAAFGQETRGRDLRELEARERRHDAPHNEILTGS